MTQRLLNATLVSLVFCIVSCQQTSEPTFETYLQRYPASDELFSEILVYKDVFAPHEKALNRLANSIPDLDNRWAGVNPVKRSGNEFAVYIVNYDSLVQDGAICGSRPQSQFKPFCRKALAIRNNCAVVQKQVVACDHQFVMRMSILATMRWLEFISDKSSEKRSSTTLQVNNLLVSEFSSKETIYEMAGVVYKYQRTRREGLYRNRSPEEKKLLEKDYEAVLSGLWKFVFLHEIGHLIMNHVTNDGLPVCVVDQSSPVVKFPVLNIEEEADLYVIETLSKTSPPLQQARDNFFAATFFNTLLDFERIRAYLDAGATLDQLNDWALDTETATIGTSIYLVRTCGGKHPYLSLRSLRLLKADYYSAHFNGDRTERQLDFLQKEIRAHEKECKKITPEIRELVNAYLRQKESSAPPSR